MDGNMKKLFIVSILILLFLTTTTVASAQFLPTQLTDNTYNDYSPQINDSGQVAWMGNNGSSMEIFYYNGSTVTQLSDNSYYEIDPKINVSGHVVWRGQGGTDGGTDYEIFYYDGSTVTQLTSNSYQEYAPQINDSGHVVWQGSGMGSATEFDIFYYDGSTVTQLSDNPYFEYDPQINDSGHVVWHGQGGSDGGSDYEIFYYNGSTVTQLTNNSTGDIYPQINDSGHVVWMGQGGSDGGSDYEIFYYNGSTVTQLNENSGLGEEPKINSSGHVVWDGPYSNGKTFYYDGSIVTQLTNSGKDPQINDIGHVVWSGSDGSDLEIFLLELSFGDSDNDTILDFHDNCPDHCNVQQLDADNDAIGDVCDSTPDCGGCGQPICEQTCIAVDTDVDGFVDFADNCPDLPNPDQADVDSNGIGNVCDGNTIYGYVSGDFQKGTKVRLYRSSCGNNILVHTAITNSEGYYIFGGLENGDYSIVPGKYDYNLFNPELVSIEIPQAVVQSYDFTETSIPCDTVERFLDNSDGTVTDECTGLIWLKVASCYGSLPWEVAVTFAAGLNSGECGLSDGSIEGDWRLSNIEELIDIGGGDKDNLGDIENSDFFTDHFIINNWTKPGAPFINVQNAYHPLNDISYYHYEMGWYRLGLSVSDSHNHFHADYFPPAAWAWPVRSAD
jgi:hypothetical protein